MLHHFDQSETNGFWAQLWQLVVLFFQVKLVDGEGIINPKAFYNYLSAWASNDALAYGASQANLRPEPKPWYHAAEDFELKIPKSTPLIYTQLPFYLHGLGDTQHITQLIAQVHNILFNNGCLTLQCQPQCTAWVFNPLALNVRYAHHALQCSEFWHIRYRLWPFNDLPYEHLISIPVSCLSHPAFSSSTKGFILHILSGLEHRMVMNKINLQHQHHWRVRMEDNLPEQTLNTSDFRLVMLILKPN